VIGALLLGLVMGAVVRAIIPNDAFEQMSGWRSWLVSIALGLVGAVVGWLIFTALIGIGDDDVFDWGGLLSAFIGTLIVASALLGRLAEHFESWSGHSLKDRRYMWKVEY